MKPWQRALLVCVVSLVLGFGAGSLGASPPALGLLIVTTVAVLIGVERLMARESNVGSAASRPRPARHVTVLFWTGIACASVGIMVRFAPITGTPRVVVTYALLGLAIAAFVLARLTHRSGE